MAGLKAAAAIKEAWVEDWKTAFPLTPRFWSENLPFRVLEGEVSLAVLQDECASGIADVENFIC